MKLSSISAERLSMSSQHRDSALVITACGDLDVTTRDPLDDCLTRARCECDHIILDLAAVEFMDCASLAVIVAHWKAVTARGGTLTLTSLRYLPARVLHLTGLAAVLPVRDSADHALEAMAAGQAVPLSGAGGLTRRISRSERFRHRLEVVLVGRRGSGGVSGSVRS